MTERCNKELLILSMEESESAGRGNKRSDFRLSTRPGGKRRCSLAGQRKT